MQDEPHVLTLGDGGPVRLRGRSQLALTISQRYRIVEDTGPRGPWKASIAGYIYALDVQDEGELIAYHWHPEARGAPTTPHLHIGKAAGLGYPNLEGSHLPSGRVAVEELLRLAISELGIDARRDDWADVLDETQLAHETWRTWPRPGQPLS